LRGVDAIAPLLFNAVLEIAIGRSRVKTRGNIFDKCSQVVACADNVVVVGRRFKDVKSSLYITGRTNS
jgi:c-di-AMP phosphodiesterase-like protein